MQLGVSLLVRFRVIGECIPSNLKKRMAEILQIYFKAIKLLVTN